MENRAPKIDNPRLIDKTIADMQDGLVESLPWLNKAFGRAQRLVKKINNRDYYSPNVYADKNNYIIVNPDSKIGNFCFFYMDDPQEIKTQNVPGSTGLIKGNCSIIFWFDLRTIFNDVSNRNTEFVKEQILKALNGGFWLKSGRFTVERVHELAENIYRGFSLEEVDNQFLMHPFAGFRFSGEIIVFENC